MKKNSIVVVGGIPKPIGGVTTFILRLVTSWPTKVASVIDLYPNTDKDPISVSHVVIPQGSIGLLFLYFLFRVHSPVYFNFSNPRGILLIGLLPKIGSTKWGVTLHNGNLSKSSYKGWLSSVLFRRGLKKCDLFGALSLQQIEYFKSNEVPINRIRRISSFIPRDWGKISDPSPNKLPEICKWISEAAKIFVISGYPTNIYQHLIVFDVFQKLWDDGNHNIRLAAFLYGDDSDGLLTELIQKFNGTEYSRVYFGIDEATFLSALKASSAYIRMNLVDSYGVAVAEAISLKKKVLATNVCDRYPGAVIIDPCDLAGLEKFILSTCTDITPPMTATEHLNAIDSRTDKFLDELINISNKIN